MKREAIAAASMIGATVAMVAMTSLASFPAFAADPAPAPAASMTAPGTERAATLEAVPGKAYKQVVLSAKAADRAGIEQGKVIEQPIAATQMFGAIVVDAASAGIEPSPARGNAKPLAVRVALSPAEAGRIDRTKPAQILTLETRPALSSTISATPIENASAEAQRSGMLMISYAIVGDGGGLASGKRVRAALPIVGSGEAKKTVPYSSILYDAKGLAWIYVVTSPLHYLREPVEVERVVGTLAVLSKGPDSGTPVVTVGASLLNGVEVFGK